MPDGIMVIQNITGSGAVLYMHCDDPYNETCRFEQAALQGQLWFDLYHNAANLIQSLDEVGWYSVSLTDGA